MRRLVGCRVRASSPPSNTPQPAKAGCRVAARGVQTMVVSKPASPPRAPASPLVDEKLSTCSRAAHDKGPSSVDAAAIHRPA
jgi:hypothetical protein